MESGKHFLVIEIARHLERFSTFGCRLLLYSRNRLHRAIYCFDAFAAAEVHAFNLERLHLLAFGTGVGHDFDIGIAALAIKAVGDERVDGFLDGRVIR